MLLAPRGAAEGQRSASSTPPTQELLPPAQAPHGVPAPCPASCRCLVLLLPPIAEPFCGRQRAAELLYLGVQGAT